MSSVQSDLGFDAPLILQPLSLDWLARSGVEVALLRLDLLDPELSGNKWFKLIKHLDAARSVAAPGLISLGGPHSNHLHALAAADSAWLLSGCCAGMSR